MHWILLFCQCNTLCIHLKDLVHKQCILAESEEEKNSHTMGYWGMKLPGETLRKKLGTFHDKYFLCIFALKPGIDRHKQLK